MLWLSSYIQNWQMTKIDHLPTKHKLLHFTSSTPTIDVEPEKALVNSRASFAHKVNIDISIVTVIVTFDGGGEGSRTPVRNRIRKSISGCSSCFNIPSAVRP